MPKPWLLFLALFCSIGFAQQQTPATPQPVPSPDPPQPLASSATITAVTEVWLDIKSCASEKEFRSSITSPFIFNGQAIEQGAELIGRIQACNRDLTGKQLQMAAVAIDAVLLPNKRTMPILALLQALGPPPPPTRVTPTGSDIGYVPSMEFHQDTRINNAAPGEGDITDVARRSATSIGLLDRISTGVVGLKHINFENTEIGNSLLWIFVADSDSLEIKGDSQLVVRFIIAPSANHP